MKAILYIGHGTRSKKGAEEATNFVKRVMKRVAAPIQELGFLELTKPLIDEGFRRCVERGATEISVIPLFLLAAGHIKEDIPRILSELKKTFPDVRVDVKDPFGVQDRLLDGIAELINQTVPELSDKDAVLLVGRGSSDPSIPQAFAEMAKGILKRLNVERVQVCYLAAAEPRLKAGLETLVQATAGQIIVVPYLLFSGLLLAEVNQMVQKWQKQGAKIVHTGQLSTHHVIEEIVYEQASR